MATDRAHKCVEKTGYLTGVKDCAERMHCRRDARTVSRRWKRRVSIVQTRNNMDYICLNGTEQVLIESEQAQARSEVIGQYKQCRKDKKMTQTELARRTGISQPNINRFESGNYNPSLEMLVKVALALDMELSIQLKERDKAAEM